MQISLICDSPSELNYTKPTNIFISFRYNYHLKEANELKKYINDIGGFRIVNIEDEKISDKNKIYSWIDERLSNTDVVILIIGNNSFASDFVKYEIMKSAEQGKSFVTVFIDNKVNNPLTDETYTGELSSLYKLFPSCLFGEIKSKDDIYNLIKKAKEIGKTLNIKQLRSMLN